MEEVFEHTITISRGFYQCVESYFGESTFFHLTWPIKWLLIFNPHLPISITFGNLYVKPNSHCSYGLHDILSTINLMQRKRIPDTIIALYNSLMLSRRPYTIYLPMSLELSPQRTRNILNYSDIMPPSSRFL
jgi:hypothetical protein